DRKADIFDEDIHALVSEQASGQHPDERIGLVAMSQSSAIGDQPRAHVTLSIDGREVAAESTGNGPVDATLRAIESLAASGADMTLYSVNAISGGTEAQGEVTVRLQKAGRVVNGVGADPDIVVASAKAYVNAVNRLQSPVERLNPQIDTT